METKLPIQEEIDKTLDTASQISKVKASPFFRDKVLHKLFDKNEVELHNMFAWFTPKLQLITLTVVVTINLVVFLNLETTDTTETLTEFEEAYELSSSSEVTIFD